MQPDPAGRSVPVPGWDRGAAITEEADEDPESYRPQQASRTAKAGTPACTGPAYWKGWDFHPGLGKRGGVPRLTSSSTVLSSEAGKDRS